MKEFIIGATFRVQATTMQEAMTVVDSRVKGISIFGSGIIQDARVTYLKEVEERQLPVPPEIGG